METEGDRSDAGRLSVRRSEGFVAPVRRIRRCGFRERV